VLKYQHKSWYISNINNCFTFTFQVCNNKKGTLWNTWKFNNTSGRQYSWLQKIQYRQLLSVLY